MEKQSVVFLGDSLTEWGNWQELFPEKKIINCGIAGNTTGDILDRLEDVIKWNPQKLFLMAGINDLGNGDDAETTFTNYKKIVCRLEEACSGSEIYLLSVLPIDTDRFYNPKLDEQQITQLNARIRNLAVGKGCNFIDMFDVFLAEDNNLNDELSPDGLHLNNDGYLLWKSLVEKYL